MIILDKFLNVKAGWENFAEIATQDPEIETQLVFDTKHHHYQLVNVGWKNQRRVYGCFLHIDIKDGKVWLRWWDTEGNLLLWSSEQAEQERQRAEQERQRADILAAKLRELGIDPGA